MLTSLAESGRGYAKKLPCLCELTAPVDMQCICGKDRSRLTFRGKELPGITEVRGVDDRAVDDESLDLTSSICAAKSLNETFLVWIRRLKAELGDSPILRNI